jgi:hypothetical protein
MEAAGIELGPKSSENPQGGITSGAESGALRVPNAPLDPELAAVINAWPALPEAIKDCILAILRAAK